MDERIVFRRVKLWDACFAKILELHVITHELAHVVFKRLGAEGHFGREGMHPGRCPCQDSSACRVRRVEQWANGCAIRGSLETTGSDWWSMAIGGSGVNLVSSKSRCDRDGGSCGLDDVNTWSDGRRVIRGGLRSEGGIDKDRRVNH